MLKFWEEGKCRDRRRKAADTQTLIDIQTTHSRIQTSLTTLRMQNPTRCMHAAVILCPGRDVVVVILGVAVVVVVMLGDSVVASSVDVVMVGVAVVV